LILVDGEISCRSSVLVALAANDRSRSCYGRGGPAAPSVTYHHVAQDTGRRLLPCKGESWCRSTLYGTTHVEKDTTKIAPFL
jgi:hypothetical protein